MATAKKPAKSKSSAASRKKSRVPSAEKTVILVVDHGLVIDPRNRSKHYTAGDEIVAPCDEHGTPLDRFWRARVREGSLKPKQARKTAAPKAPKPTGS